MKVLFDLLPVAILGLTYAVTKDFAIAAYCFTASAWLLVAYSFLVKRKVEQLHWFTAILATIAAAIIYFTGDTFMFKFKSSIINWLVALFLIGTIFFAKKTLLESIMGEQMQAPSSAWRQLTWVLGISFIILGAINAYIAIVYDDPSEEDVWIIFKIVSSVGLMLVMFVAGGKILWPHIKEQVAAENEKHSNEKHNPVEKTQEDKPLD